MRSFLPLQGRRLSVIAVVSLLLFLCSLPTGAHGASPAHGGRSVGVGPQYDTTHVYIQHGMLKAFVTSWEATFGGTNSVVSIVDVTPTSSKTQSELVFSPVGTLSVFDFLTPIPYPFGSERTGWLLANFDQGMHAAKASGADVIVAPWNDPVGRDAIIQFPGGIMTQLYWHTRAPSYAKLASIPENRVYLTPDATNAFLRDYLTFTSGRVVSDNRHADAGEIGLPGQTYRRVRITSIFGDTVVAITDGHLPYPFGREMTGYSVTNLDATLKAARSAGAVVLWGPYSAQGRNTAVVQFPGGFIAEIHDAKTP